VIVSLSLDGAFVLLFHIYIGEVTGELAVRITESPAQKVSAPLEAISGFAGRLFAVTMTASLAGDVHWLASLT
jgi:hypothetical protein